MTFVRWKNSIFKKLLYFFLILISFTTHNFFNLFSERNIVSLQDILNELRSNERIQSKRSYINVRRRHVWEDACRHLCRKKFDPRAIISVKFADDDGNSEGAVDAGGPRREFLKLLVKAANEESGLFFRKLDQRILFANASGKLRICKEKIVCAVDDFLT